MPNLQRTYVKDTLTESELKSIPPERLDNKLTLIERTYQALLEAQNINMDDIDDYILLVYNEKNQLDFVLDLATPHKDGIKGLAIEIPYSYELRSLTELGIDLEELQKQMYKHKYVLRHNTVHAFEKLYRKAN